VKKNYEITVMIHLKLRPKLEIKIAVTYHLISSD